jgi:hypothetical protein
MAHQVGGVSDERRAVDGTLGQSRKGRRAARKVDIHRKGTWPQLSDGGQRLASR